MNAQAVIFEGPKNIKLSKLEVNEMVEGDVEIDVAYTGISTGTERLLWEGSMPNFPGMGYPLVPGYEAVGQIKKNNSKFDLKEGTMSLCQVLTHLRMSATYLEALALASWFLLNG